jgi:hypothetical protein
MKYITFLLLVSLNVSAQEDFLEQNKIQLWWESVSDEKISVIDNSYKPFYLTNKEKAYLAKVHVEGRGRNFNSQIILIRPDNKKVILLSETITHDFEIYDLDNNGISEIVGVSLGSGQGSTRGRKSIVQIDEWDRVIVLREMNFRDNSGAYGKKDNRYYMKDIIWEFSDFDSDGVKDLLETRIVHEGRNNRNPVVTQGLYKYVYKNNEFIRYTNYKNGSQRKDNN